MRKQPYRILLTVVHVGLLLFGAFLNASGETLAFPISTGADPYKESIAPETENIAIFGYDPVAYFIEGRAMEGNKEFELEFGEARWRFSNAKNLNAFAGTPDKYLPQYGGFCTVCMVEHKRLFDANPRIWSIINGKLYLNSNLRSREEFRRSANQYIQRADELWVKLGRSSESRFHEQHPYTIAVLRPFSPSGDTRQLLLGGEIYKTLRQQDWLSITHADEPADPSARSSLNRGGDWPFPPASVDQTEAWQGDIYYKNPNLDRLYRAGQELGADALVMWYFAPNQYVGQWPVEMYVIDVRQQRVYMHRGVNTEAGSLVRRALADFRAGREP